MKSKLLNAFGLAAGPPAAVSYMNLCYKTTKWEKVNVEETRALIRETGGIAAVWHARFIMLPYLPDQPTVVMIGQHSDAEYFARILRKFNIELTRGSSTRGGTAALKLTMEYVERGYMAGMAPDGPRGPAREAKMGIVELARLTEKPIYPLTYAVQRHKRMGSWDSMMIPMPFTKGIYICGEPIRVEAEADRDQLEQARRQVENELNRITDEADRFCGILK